MNKKFDIHSSDIRINNTHKVRRVVGRGFTIVELVIVIAIIGILATLSFVGYNTVQGSARDKSILSDLDTLDGIQTNYGLSTSTVGKVWYSGNGVDSSLNFNPSTGNVIDAVVNSTDYCIRAYNPSSATYKTIGTAAIKESSPGACSVIVASSDATGIVCPSGFIVVPGSTTYGTTTFCTMKYAAKQASATVPISQAAGLPWVNISRTNAQTYAANVSGCSGCHLITDAEWLTIAQNVMSVASNWSGGAVGSGSLYVGHTDNAPANALAADTNDSNGYYGVTNTGGNQRRTLTLTNGEVIWDLSGNTNSWTQGTIASGQSPGVVGSPGGNWRNYNDGTMNMNGLPSYNLPSYANPAAAAWDNDNEGIGELYGDYEAVTAYAYQRGCYYGADLVPSAHCGIFSLYLLNPATYTSSGIGFRVSK